MLDNTTTAALANLTLDQKREAIEVLQQDLKPKDHEARGYLRDQRGNKSSKRLWATIFGACAIVQAGVFLALLFIPGSPNVTNTVVMDTFRYTFTTTSVLCATCLGLTLPEWFAKP